MFPLLWVPELFPCLSYGNSRLTNSVTNQATQLNSNDSLSVLLVTSRQGPQRKHLSYVAVYGPLPSNGCTYHSIFWDVTSCCTVEVHGRFGGTYCLHIESLRDSEARKMQIATRNFETSLNFCRTTREKTLCFRWKLGQLFPFKLITQ
jgi:hypothetical protein